MTKSEEIKTTALEELAALCPGSSYKRFVKATNEIALAALEAAAKAQAEELCDGPLIINIMESQFDGKTLAVSINNIRHGPDAGPWTILKTIRSRTK